MHEDKIWGPLDRGIFPAIHSGSYLPYTKGELSRSSVLDTFSVDKIPLFRGPQFSPSALGLTRMTRGNFWRIATHRRAPN